MADPLQNNDQCAHQDNNQSIGKRQGRFAPVSAFSRRTRRPGKRPARKKVTIRPICK